VRPGAQPAATSDIRHESPARRRRGHRAQINPELEIDILTSIVPRVPFHVVRGRSARPQVLRHMKLQRRGLFLLGAPAGGHQAPPACAQAARPLVRALRAAA